MWFDSVILDDIDDEIDSHCRTFLHPNGYTNALNLWRKHFEAEWTASSESARGPFLD